MARAGGRLTWDGFAANNRDLMSWENSILRLYYREETLASELAKRTFLFPDRIGTTSQIQVLRCAPSAAPQSRCSG
jgi:hypothetical protein